VERQLCLALSVSSINRRPVKEKTLQRIDRNIIIARLVGGILLTGSLTIPPAHAQNQQAVAPGVYATLPIPASLDPQSSTTGINAEGEVIGNIEEGGYLLRNGTISIIAYPGALATAVFGINPSGDIVGDCLDQDGQQHAFLLSRGVFTSFDFPGALETRAVAINPEGEIVGDYIASDFTIHGFRLTKP
jgi:hypothetical protein